MPTPIPSARTAKTAWLLSLCAGAAGFFMNGFGMAVFGGTEIIFGGCGVLLVGYCFGPVPAMLAAMIAFSRTLWTWGHPWGLICLVLEAGVVGWLTHRRQWEPLLASLVFWAVIGVPLAMLTIIGIQDVPFPGSWGIILKYPTNSLLMTMLALPFFHSRRFRQRIGLPLDHERGTPLQAVLSQRFGNVIALSILMLSLVVGRLFDRQLRDMRREDLVNHTRELGLELQGHLSLNQHALQLLADNLRDTPTSDVAALDLLVDALRKNHPAFLTTLIADPEGLIVAASPGKNGDGVAMARNGFSVSDREYFRQPMLTKTAFVSPVFRGRGFGNDLIVAMSVPVANASGTPTMVLEGSLDVGRLTTILGRAGQVGERALLITDATGHVVASRRQLNVGERGVLRGEPFLLSSNARDDASDFTFDMENEGRNERFIAASYRLPEFGWRLYLAEPLWDTQRIIARYYVATAVWSLLTIALALMLSRAISEEITRPLKRLVAAVRGLSKNEHPEPDVPIPPIAEELSQIEQELRSATRTLSESNRQLASAIEQRDDTHRELQNLLVHLEDKVKQRTVQLDEARQHAESANEAKSEFLASMSHELRTPLNVILGMSELVEDNSLGPLTDRQLESVRHIRESGQHLLSLITDILDLSKVEAGMLELGLSASNLRDICEASMRFVRESARRKNIDLETRYEFFVENIVVDPRRMKQILVNLLSNAVKFTPEGGMVGLVVRQLPTPPCIEFEVWDTGIGIAAKDRDKLFKPFQQIDSSLSRQYAGTGLGLALVRRMSELHGGEVRLESAPEKGSRFTVSIPLVTEDSAAAGTDGLMIVKKFSPASSAKRYRILIAEDNDANIQVYVRYLKPRGHELILAANGAEAIDRTLTAKPDLVLMDIHMPVMDGLEAMRRLRADPRTAHVPIIAVTALAMSGDQAKCLSAGANAYVTKPVNLNELARLISELGPRDSSAGSHELFP